MERPSSDRGHLGVDLTQGAPRLTWDVPVTDADRRRGWVALPARATTSRRVFDLEGAGYQAECVAMIDTGADISVAPKALIEALHLEQVSTTDVIGAGGLTRDVPMYLLDLHIGPLRPIVNLLVAVDLHLPRVVVGRDVLARWRVTLDGPSGGLQISEADPTIRVALAKRGR